MAAHGEVPVRVDVGASFAALARDLRRAGAGGLRKELYAGLQRSARPAITAVRESAASTLPRRGGLAARVAGSSITARSSGGRNPGIRITAKERKASFDAYALDQGRLRHPVYGVWRRGIKTQKVTPGWFTKPITDQAPTFRKELLRAVDAIERDISG